MKIITKVKHTLNHELRLMAKTKSIFGALVLCVMGACSSVNKSTRPNQEFIDALSSTSLKTIIDISPDLNHFIVQGIGTSVIQNVNDPDDITPLPGQIAIYNKMWSWNPDYLIMTLDEGGNEKDRIYSYNIKTKTLLPLSPESARSTLLKVSHKHPNEILILSNQRDARWFDVYKVDITTGKSEKIFENTQFNNFLADEDLNLKAAIRENGLHHKEVWVNENGCPTRKFAFPHSDEVDLLYTDGPHIYLLDNRGRDTKALLKWDLSDNTFTPLAEHPKTDITHVLFNQETSAPVIYRTDYLQPEWHGLTPTHIKGIQHLKSLENGVFELGACDAGKNKCIATYLMENNYKFYQYDFKQQKATFLLTSSCYFDHHADQFSKTYPKEIKARDGVVLPTYLTLPKSLDPNNNGMTKSPAPMIVLIHGGPWERDTWGFSPTIQKYAAVGCAVLQINYRGSDGFGKQFLNLGQKELGGKMIDDIIDGVQWAIDQNIADPNKVVLMGGSYGGFAVYRALQKAPGLFTGGIIIAGFPDLKEFIEKSPAYWEGFKGMMHNRIGDPKTEADLLKNQSPLSHIEKITKPLLVFHGQNDARVSVDGTRHMVQRLTENGVDVTYVEFPDEGHTTFYGYNTGAQDYLIHQFLERHLNHTDYTSNAYRLEQTTGHIFKQGKFYPLATQACKNRSNI